MSSYKEKQTRYVASMAGIAGFILVVGYWLKPAEVPEPTISQAETSRLRRSTQRSGLEDLSSYMGDIAAQVQGSVVWVDELGASGLIWSPDGLVVTAGPMMGTTEVTALTVGGTVPLTTLPERSGRIVTATQAPVTFGLQTPTRRAVSNILPGTWVFQVGRDAAGGYRFTQATIGGMARVTCNGITYDAIQSTLPLNEASLGSGIFDLDENLLAMVVRCGSGYAAITPQGIDLALQRAASTLSKLERFYGVTASDLTEEAAAYFGRSSGAWISAVTVGQTPAELEPGDVIVAVGSQAVSNMEALANLFTPQDRAFAVTVVRNGRRVEVPLRPAIPMTPRPTAEGSAGEPRGDGSGIVLAPPEAGFLIESLEPASLGARGGLEPGDRLISLNGQRPRTLAQAQTSLNQLASDSRSGPALLVYQRGNVQTGVLLP